MIFDEIALPINENEINFPINDKHVYNRNAVSQAQIISHE